MKFTVEKLLFVLAVFIVSVVTPNSSFARMDKDEIEKGRVVSTQCAVCHGPRGEGNGMPKSCIACLDANTLTQYIHDFKSGKRKNYMMERISKQLSKKDLVNLHAYYASLDKDH